MYGLANYSGITGAFYVAAVVNLFLLPSITDAALFLSPL
jgi:energy-converting hydrogenase Eha subunit G